MFGFDLNDCKITGCTYVKNVDDTVTSNRTKLLGICKQSQKKLKGFFVTHIDGDLVFCTTQTADKLKSLYEQFLKSKDQGIAKDFF